MKKRRRLKTVRSLDRQTGQYSETRGLRSVAFNVREGSPSTSDGTEDQLHDLAEEFLVKIGETTPRRIMEAGHARGASPSEMAKEMVDLTTRLNSKYGLLSPAACAGQFLVTRYAVVMDVFRLLIEAGKDIDEASDILQNVDAYADAWHYWHMELKGEHVSAAAKAEETARLRKQGQATADKGEIRAEIIRAAADKRRGRIADIARAIRDDVEKAFMAAGLAPANSDRAFYEEVRLAVKNAKPSGFPGSEID
jgi:hypothetical protein